MGTAKIKVKGLRLNEEELFELFNKHYSTFREFFFEQLTAEEVIEHYEGIGLDFLVEPIKPSDLWSAMSDEQVEEFTNNVLDAHRDEIRTMNILAQGQNKSKKRGKK